jgi:hypothetical protein
MLTELVTELVTNMMPRMVMPEQDPLRQPYKCPPKAFSENNNHAFYVQTQGIICTFYGN